MAKRGVKIKIEEPDKLTLEVLDTYVQESWDALTRLNDQINKSHGTNLPLEKSDIKVRIDYTFNGLEMYMWHHQPEVEYLDE